MSQTIVLEDQNSPLETTEFLKKLEGLPEVEEKLRASIAFMREALAQKGSPNFKGFWEVRKLCLPLFKEPLAGPARGQLWAEYIELTREGRHLKNILDEETAFAVEQIDLAISSLEKEADIFAKDLETLLKETADIDFPKESVTLKDRYGDYQRFQKQLNILNVFATRINSLRKELIRTEMRIRQKNQFFQRLSRLGDLVFPARKELIHQVSDAFTSDVEGFVTKHFAEDNFTHEDVRRSVFFFRDEIKVLQATAKVLTLNTQAFSKTRQELSQCWDKLKGMEKELKKEFAHQKIKSSENATQVHERIQAFVSDYAAGKYTAEAGQQELEAISRLMRDLELTRQDVYSLKDALARAREPIEVKRNEEEDARRQKQEEFEQVRREKVEQFKLQIDSLSSRVGSEEIETLLKELEECRKNFSTLTMMKVERQQIDRKLKMIRDQITEKQEQALLALSADDRATLDNFQSILSQRKERRKEVKAQLEEYRKICGGSDLDFEKAMRMQELTNCEKERLAKLDEGIKEIEQKIRGLKGA